MQDPCLTITRISIVPATIENFVAFAGYNNNSLLKYTLITDTVDFCGEKQVRFSINSTTTQYLSANNQDFIHFTPPANTTSFGVGTATAVAMMKNYPTIESAPISFEVTILGSVVPFLAD